MKKLLFILLIPFILSAQNIFPGWTGYPYYLTQSQEAAASISAPTIQFDSLGVDSTEWIATGWPSNSTNNRLFFKTSSMSSLGDTTGYDSLFVSSDSISVAHWAHGLTDNASVYYLLYQYNDSASKVTTGSYAIPDMWAPSAPTLTFAGLSQTVFGDSINISVFNPGSDPDWAQFAVQHRDENSGSWTTIWSGSDTSNADSTIRWFPWSLSVDANADTLELRAGVADEVPNWTYTAIDTTIMASRSSLQVKAGLGYALAASNVSVARALVNDDSSTTGGDSARFVYSQGDLYRVDDTVDSVYVYLDSLLAMQVASDDQIYGFLRWDSLGTLGPYGAGVAFPAGGGGGGCDNLMDQTIGASGGDVDLGRFSRIHYTTLVVWDSVYTNPLCSAILPLAKVGSPTANIKMFIWDCANIAPTTKIDSSDVKDSSTLTGSEADYTFTGWSGNYTPTQGDSVFIGLYIETPDNDNYVNWFYDTAEDDELVLRSTDGVGWALESAANSLRYQVYTQ